MNAVTRAGALCNMSLERRAWNIRRKAPLMGEAHGQGYAGQALGVADVPAASYVHALAFRSEDPEWEGRDRFQLSIGRCAIALYAVLMEAGILPEEELETYGMDDGCMPMSGMASCTPGMEIAGGSLGHGLAGGMATELKRKNNLAVVCNLMSDGELGEGSIREAVMSGARWKLDNLIRLGDFNDRQADGRTAAALATGEEADAWRALGWHARRVDGDDMAAVVAAFDAARITRGAPGHHLRRHDAQRRAVPRGARVHPFRARRGR